MGVFHHEEPPNLSRKCKFLSAALKDAFSNCRNCSRISTTSPEVEYTANDMEDEQEILVSEIRSRAMEKSKQRSFVLTDSFSWVFSPRTGELFLAPKIVMQKAGEEDEDDENRDGEDDEREEFVSVRSCFTCGSSSVSKEAFLSVHTNLSRCSSFSELIEIKEFEFPRRNILQELCHCEGWPFGLCRKAVLLPPLPKSPTESWSWRKRSRIAKTKQFQFC